MFILSVPVKVWLNRDSILKLIGKSKHHLGEGDKKEEEKKYIEGLGIHTCILASRPECGDLELGMPRADETIPRMSSRCGRVLRTLWSTRAHHRTCTPQRSLVPQPDINGCAVYIAIRMLQVRRLGGIRGVRTNHPILLKGPLRR